MNNKEKILSKIGKLIDKAGIKEEELSFFFQPEDEEPTTEEATETGEAENAQAEVGGSEGTAEESEAKTEETHEEALPEEGKDPSEEPHPEAQGEIEHKEEPGSIEAILAKLDDMAKSIEAVTKENADLKNALKEANVLSAPKDEKQDIGINSTSAPSVGESEGLAEALARANRGR